MRERTVYGWGINDANYPVTKEIKVDGKRKRIWMCPFYRTWTSMIQRCYSRRSRPSYSDCSVSEEWRRFSDFKDWMKSQDWEGKELDKDIIISGNKIYSPKTCAFVEHKINSFIVDRKAGRGAHPLGVSYRKQAGNYEVHCNNPITGGRDYLGVYEDANQAHLAWKSKKHEFACQLADMQSDNRVATALRNRYLDEPSRRDRK